MFVVVQQLKKTSLWSTSFSYSQIICLTIVLHHIAIGKLRGIVTAKESPQLP